MSITTQDIAKLANVNQSTVSRCLNNSPLVSEKTKQRILKIAEENGFQFNASARSLITKRTNTIGIVFPKSLLEQGLSVHFTSWLNALIESLGELEFDAMVSFSENETTGQNNIKKLITAKKIDGLIILHPDLDKETVDFLEKSNIPFIFSKYLPANCKTKDVDYVYVDQFKGGYLATEHLIKLGHERILCISANISGGEFDLRTEGYKSAIYDNNLSFNKDLLFFGDSTFNSGYTVIKENDTILKNITAIFAQNDLMALGAMSALNELQINVPNDIAVVGYDDIQLCTYFKPYLTSILQPTNEVAILTCKRLVEALNSNGTSMKQNLSIQPKLVIRESCGI
jgi:LacI family transcriptional regulator